MKKLLLLSALFVFNFSLHSQKWQVETRNDAFSGKVSVAYTVGYDGRFPYNNPIIAFRRDNDGSVYGIISNAGSLVCDGGSLTFAFNGKFEDKLQVYLSSSNDNDRGFFGESYADNKKIIQLVDKLKSSNYSEVLFDTDCSSNRFKISLSGSTKALNEVIGDYYIIERNSFFASEKIKLDSINEAKASIMPKYRKWKINIDNDIISIYEKYIIRDKYDEKKIYSFEDFKTVCYKELSDDSNLSEEDKLLPPLLAYYKKFNIGYLKKYNNNFIVNLYIKKHYGNDELIALEKDGGENTIFAYRQQWMFEKKPQPEEYNKIEVESVLEETDNSVNTQKVENFSDEKQQNFIFTKVYMSGSKVKMEGAFTFSENYWQLDLNGTPSPRVSFENRVSLGENHWQEISTAGGIKSEIEYNGNNDKYKSNGGTLTTKAVGYTMIYVLNKNPN